MQLFITVPGEPVAKGRPRMTRAGFAYTPKKTVNYETQIQERFATEYPDHKPVDGQLKILVWAYFTIPASWSKKKQQAALDGSIRPTKKPDIDNIIKTMDALNGIAWRDDSQVVHVTASKYYSDRPRLEIQIQEA